MIRARRTTATTRTVRPVVVLMLVAGLLLSACTSSQPKAKPTTTKPTTAAATTTPTTPGTTVSPTPSQVAKIAFADCTGQITPTLPSDQAPRVSNLSFGCGHLDVPLDYSHPTGAKVRLYVVKAHYAAQTGRIGSLVVNPGGPGGSGVQLAISLSVELDTSVVSKFDLVGFDPRGVFLSEPVQCTTDAQKDALLAANPDVRTAAGLAAAVRLQGAVGTMCAKKYGAALQYYNTEATARDMDLLRQGLAEPTLNYLGYSYGTELGAVYAHLFPTRIRTMVLDGAVDTTASFLTSSERQVAGFESAFNQFAADCAQRSACKVLGPARAAVAQLVARADRAPIRTSRSGDKRSATGATVLNATAAALYDQGRWGPLGDALIAARNGDSAKLFVLADSLWDRGDDGHFSNLLDAFATVTCNDSTQMLTPASVQADAKVWAVKYPLFGIQAAGQLLMCQNWQTRRHPVPSVAAPGAKPILVIGTVHDPATPYTDAGVLAAGLKSGVLLSWNGQGHTAYPKTKCITSAVDSYLIDAAVPAAKTTCPLK